MNSPDLGKPNPIMTQNIPISASSSRASSIWAKMKRVLNSCTLPETIFAVGAVVVGVGSALVLAGVVFAVSPLIAGAGVGLAIGGTIVSCIMLAISCYRSRTRSSSPKEEIVNPYLLENNFIQIPGDCSA